MLDGTNPYAIDITEIEDFDNLHHAESIIKDAEDAAAKMYGAKKAYYLVNGSTCGILAAISASVKPIRVYFLSFLPAVCNKFYVLRESLFSDSLLLIYLHCSLAGGCSRNP